MKLWTIIAWTSGTAVWGRILPPNSDNYSLDHALNVSEAATNFPPKFAIGTSLDDDGWKEAVAFGCSLVNAMNSPDELAVSFFPNELGTIQSQFTTDQDLTDWGYSYDNLPITDLEGEGPGPVIGDTLQALGIDYRRSPAGPLYYYGWDHDRQTVHDGVTYPVTNARFWEMINVDDGIIIAWVKYGPKWAGREMVHPPVENGPYPKLKQWADIVFLDWQRTARARQKDISNLKYFISSGVLNDETKAIVRRALKSDDICEGNYGWDNHKEIKMDTEEGKAVLSSPNGRGMALFLIRHKQALGKRSIIDKVSIWCYRYEDEDPDPDDPPWALHLLFHVKKQSDKWEVDPWQEPDIPDDHGCKCEFVLPHRT
ncbi:hypothetical protein BDV96DRAFT_594378 [Lophiotrema nucula]|uniref:Uncharacterized protein n=1 Tax=Lophiotrema nucula TaxID=690887 RepID=A0A6A5ZQK9_9PLEO|nr:hypothetical protein BDV96DRAFT_594378 [Lophiotrema nucula]